MPSFFAIIPANVRYDKSVCANAKLLYGEITALCNEKGYCWATNSYFSELYQVSNKAISRWIKELTDAGFIQSKMHYKKGTKEIEMREITICHPMDKKEDTYGQKCPYPPDENVHTPMDKNVQENSTGMNNTINNKKSDLDSIEKPFKSKNFFEKWQEWLDYRKQRKLPNYVPRGLKKTFSELKEMSGGDEQTAVSIIEQSMAKNWQGFFPLKNKIINGTKKFGDVGRTIEFDAI